jgi:hypothetical protein
VVVEVNDPEAEAEPEVEAADAVSFNTAADVDRIPVANTLFEEVVVVCSLPVPNPELVSFILSQ